MEEMRLSAKKHYRTYCPSEIIMTESFQVCTISIVALVKLFSCESGRSI